MKFAGSAPGNGDPVNWLTAQTPIAVFPSSMPIENVPGALMREGVLLRFGRVSRSAGQEPGNDATVPLAAARAGDGLNAEVVRNRRRRSAGTPSAITTKERPLVADR